MIGALLIGCGSPKKTTNNKPVATKPVATEPGVKETTEVSGQTLTEQEKQDIADGTKAKTMAEVFNKPFLTTLYSCTPSNIDQSFVTLNSQTVIQGGIFGADTNKAKESVRKVSMTLVKYNIDSFGVGLEYEVDSKTFAAVNETLTVNYMENGVAKVDKMKLTLVYNVKGDKAFSVYSIRINDSQ